MDNDKLDFVEKTEEPVEPEAPEAPEKAGFGLKDRILGAARRAADLNKDGEVNKADLGVAAGAAGTAASGAAGAAVSAAADKAGSIKDGVQERALDMEKRAYKQIIAEDLSNPNFILPTLIRITGITQKYSELNAVGCLSEYKDFRALNVFREKLDEYPLSFYPDNGSEIYYVDPTDFNRYIALDEYFGYLRTVRLEELQQIAVSLGASRFRITYLFQKPSFTSHKEESGAKAFSRLFEKRSAPAEAERGPQEIEADYMEIIAGTEGAGHDPEEPEVRYLKKDPSVQTLISQRMDPDAPEPQQKYLLKLIDSCGIKAGTAAKIDTALKDMKLSGNSTVTCEAMNEGRRYLELEIEF